MQICRTIGGYSYGRADMVRRAMSKKKKDVMEKERSAFIYGTDTNCGAVKNGVPAEIAEEIFNEMSSFASYAFNKSHAAAYAWLAYQTAYLRCHHYKEHIMSLMSIYMGSTGKLNEYISDLERHNVKLLPPDVNSSLAGFTAQGDSIKYGLLPIKNLGRGAINAIIEERKNGRYKSLYDFCSRLTGTEINKRAVEALIKSGALDSLGHTRRSMYMTYESIITRLASRKSSNIEGQLDIFSSLDTEDMEEIDFKMPQEPEFSRSQLLQMEKEITGFYLSGHPLDKYDPLIKRLGCKNIYTLINSAKEGLNGFRDGQKQPLVAMLVSKKPHTQKNGKQMCFAEFEDKSGVIEAILFSDIYEKFIGMLNEGSVYKLVGTISTDSASREDEAPKLIVNVLESANSIPDNSQVLYIRLFSDQLDIMEQAHRVLWHNQGGTQVKFCFDDVRKTARPKGITGVKVTKELLLQLEKICGKDNIVMK